MLGDVAFNLLSVLLAVGVVRLYAELCALDILIGDSPGSLKHGCDLRNFSCSGLLRLLSCIRRRIHTDRQIDDIRLDRQLAFTDYTDNVLLDIFCRIGFFRTLKHTAQPHSSYD
ncbi:hypothetical protein D3C73_1354290 [compost metagenome]